MELHVCCLAVMCISCLSNQAKTTSTEHTTFDANEGMFIWISAVFHKLFLRNLQNEHLWKHTYRPPPLLWSLRVTEKPDVFTVLNTCVTLFTNAWVINFHVSASYESHIKPFSRWHFSRVFLMRPPSLRKNSCSDGLAVVPGPLVWRYSLHSSSARE